MSDTDPIRINVTHIVVKFSDGREIAVPKTNQLRTSSVPSRRSNKNRSGRSGRKQRNGEVTIRRAGGLDVSNPGSLAHAVSRPADYEMCHTVDGSQLNTTWNLGGSCATGYISGRPTGA